MRPSACTGCRHHYRERHWWIFEIDFCDLTGDVVGFECPLGALSTTGCSDYERRPAWPEGAVV